MLRTAKKVKTVYFLLTWICIIASVEALAASKLAKNDWLLATSANIELITDAKAKVAEEMIQDLELFRSFSLKYLSEPNQEASIPLKVVVITKPSTFRSLDLDPNIAGYYSNTDYGPFILAKASDYSSHKSFGKHTLQHELVHYVTRKDNANGNLPLWYSEGLAEYLGTFEFNTDDGNISVGDIGIISRRITWLKNHDTWGYANIDTEDLFKTKSIRKPWRSLQKKKTAPVNGKAIGFEFYARAAITFHYLQSSKELMKQTIEYRNLIKAGRSVDQAFSEAYGGITYSEVDLQISNYIKQRASIWKGTPEKIGLSTNRIKISLSKIPSITPLTLLMESFSKKSKYEQDDLEKFKKVIKKAFPNTETAAYSELLYQARFDKSIFRHLVKEYASTYPSSDKILTLNATLLAVDAERLFQLGEKSYKTKVAEARAIARSLIQSNPYNIKAYKILSGLSHSIHEKDPRFLKESCDSSKIIDFLSVSYDIENINALYCALHLDDLEYAETVLNNSRNISDPAWLFPYQASLLKTSLAINDLKNYKVVETKNGIQIYENKAKFVGELEKGLPNGLGKITFIDGSSAEGSWTKGNLDGLGTIITNTGLFYTGNLVKGFASGQGEVHFEGTKIKINQVRGYFKSSMPAGNISIHYVSGLKIDGVAFNGALNGPAIISKGTRRAERIFRSGMTKLLLVDGSHFWSYLDGDGDILRNGRCFSTMNIDLGWCNSDEKITLFDGISSDTAVEVEYTNFKDK